MINVNITDNDTNQRRVPSDTIPWAQHHFCSHLTQNIQIISSQQISDKPKQQDILHSNWTTYFKNSKTMKGKKRPRNYFKLKGIKEIW